MLEAGLDHGSVVKMALVEGWKGLVEDLEGLMRCRLSMSAELAAATELPESQVPSRHWRERSA